MLRTRKALESYRVSALDRIVGNYYGRPVDWAADNRDANTHVSS
jgi:hypothetical protein